MQRIGLEFLILADGRAKRDEFGDRLRFALVTADPKEFLAKLFPELDRARLAEQDERLALARSNAVEADPEEDLEGATGTWDFSQVRMSEDQVREILARSVGPDGRPMGRMTLADLPDPDGWQ